MKIKRTLTTVLLLLCMTVTPVFASEMVSYSVPELDMTVSLPADYNYVFTRSSDEDEPILADWGISMEDLFRSDSVFLEALTETQDSEIIISMLPVDWPEELSFDLSNMDREELDGIARSLTETANNESGTDYIDCSVYENKEGISFIRTLGSFEKENAVGFAVQFITVINGNAYTLTCNLYGDTAVNEDFEATADSIAAGLYFGDVADNGQENPAVTIVLITVLILVAGLLTAYIVRRIRPGRNGDGENADREDKGDAVQD